MKLRKHLPLDVRQEAAERSGQILQTMQERTASANRVEIRDALLDFFESGVVRRLSKKYDLTGKKFGKLTALAVHPDSKRHTSWVCACECGGSSVSRGANLRNGNTTSCGCMKKESMKRATLARRLKRLEAQS